MAVTMLVPPVQHGEREAGLQFDLRNTVKYEAGSDMGGTSTAEFERQILSLYFGFKAFYVGFGIINDTTVSVDDYYGPGGDKPSGDGNVIAFGMRSKVWEEDRTATILYGQLSVSKEDIKSDMGMDNVTFESTELLIGCVGSYQIEDSYTVYAGAEIIPFSELTFESEYGRSDDIKRSDMFTLVAGASAQFEGFFFTLDVRLVGNQSIRLGIGRTF